ncbi:MAG: ComEC/Rec2 family competence protein [Bacteroidota bacterium]
MSSWAQYAIVRVVAFFTAGILLAIYIPFHTSVNQVWLYTGVFTILYFLLWCLLKKSMFIKYNLLLSLWTCFTFMMLGYLALVSSDQTNLTDHVSNFENIEAYTFTVSDNGEEKAKTIRYLVHIKSVKDGAWHPAKGKMFLYVNKELPALYYNNMYLINGKPQMVGAPMNPGEFDYQVFLSYQNIHYQQFVRVSPILVEERSSYFGISSMGSKIGLWARAVFEDHIESEQDRSIALALVLGIKDGLDNDIKKAYSATGAMHILAVSGLHVGIIYIIVSALLGKLQSTALGRWLFCCLAIAILWMYALATGFSPSVLRAVTMFSFVILARAINRKSNIYNTLAASALILLLFDPFLIMSVGFQLSYLAVFGIVFLQPRIYHLVHFDNFFIDKIWAITAVSIAAQLATFPLGLLYFHQFPTFFLLSNLVVVPGAFAILITGILMLFLSWIPTVATLIGSILGFVISVVNRVVFWIDEIPLGRINDVYITPTESWLILILVLMISLFLVVRQVKLLYAVFSVTLLICFSITTRSFENERLNRLIFYRISGHTAVEWISDNQSVLWADDELLVSSDKLAFNVRPNRLKSGVRKTKSYAFKSLTSGIEMAMVASKSVLVLRDIHQKTNFDNKPRVDFLIYSQKCRRDLKWVRDKFDFGILILGGDLSAWKAEKLLNECAELGLSCYSVHHYGAFEYEI